MDTGVTPVSDETFKHVTLPTPETFGIVDIRGVIGKRSELGGGGKVPLWSGKFKKLGLRCVAIKDESSTLEKIVLKDSNLKNKGFTHLDNELDVWLMRSPRNHPGIRRAVMFYIYLWFKITGLDDLKDNRSDLYKSASRAAIVSAAASGLTHSAEDDTGCNATAALPAGSLMNADKHVKNKDDGRTIVSELGVRKRGFRSHG